MHIIAGLNYCRHVLEVAKFYRKTFEDFKWPNFIRKLLKISNDPILSENFWRFQVAKLYRRTFEDLRRQNFIGKLFKISNGKILSENFWRFQLAKFYRKLLKISNGKILSEIFWAALRATQKFSEIWLFSKTIPLTFLQNRY